MKRKNLKREFIKGINIGLLPVMFMSLVWPVMIVTGFIIDIGIISKAAGIIFFIALLAHLTEALYAARKVKDAQIGALKLTLLTMFLGLFVLLNYKKIER